MTADEKAQVLNKIRDERQFRYNLLPPPENVETGFAAVMTELTKKCQVFTVSITTTTITSNSNDVVPV